MASDSSGEESAYSDCRSSSRQSRRQHRQQSMPEMLEKAQSRSTKRAAPGRSSRSPPDAAPPAAKRAAAVAGPLSADEAAPSPASGAGPSPADGAAPAPAPDAVELSASALAAIQLLIDAGNGRVISAFDAKIDVLERRIAILEGECFDKDEEIRCLKDKLTRQDSAIEELRQRVEGIDANRRLSSLILTCDDFVASSQSENIEDKITQAINKRLSGIQMTTDDIQAAHRLQGRNKVIVRFVRRGLRDAVYDSRFQLFGSAAGRGQRGGAPLYITESLTPGNRLIYSALLDARRSENGGKIASVFTRRGQVYCRTEKGGSNIHVPDWERLQRLLGGPARPPPSSERLAGSSAGRGGTAPSSRPPLLGNGPAPSSAPAARPGSERRAGPGSGPGGATVAERQRPHQMVAAQPESAPPVPASAPVAPSESEEAGVNHARVSALGGAG